MKYQIVDRSLGLVRHPKTGTYYFKKYVTEVGRIEVSLRTTERAEAEKALLRTYAQYLQTPKAREVVVTFDEIVRDLYEIKQGKSKSTFDSFEGTCRLHLLPYFTGFDMDTVLAAWPRYVAHAVQKTPDRQLGHDRRYLREILGRYSELYPHKLAGVPKLKLDARRRTKTQIEIYNRDEVRMILRVSAKEIRLRHPGDRALWLKEATLEKLKLYAELGLFSGMRLPGEANSLRYSNIDFEQGIARVFTSKTNQWRTYPVDPETLERLKRRRDQQKIKSDFVFPKRANPNEPATRSDKSWQRFKRATGLTKRLYWFRHSHASSAIETVPALILRKNMGTSLECLEKVYVKPGENEFHAQRTAVRKKFVGGIGDLHD